MYNLRYCNIGGKSIVIESYLLNTVALYPSLLANTQRLENPKTSIVYCGAPTFTLVTPYP